jgi:hypothetical protein
MKKLIIYPEMFKGDDGININGPSPIIVPEWIKNKLGKFYLYFAHHRGKYIRLAYSDHIEGPYKLLEGGTLKLSDALDCEDHIASPDVHVDHANQKIYMLFHGKSINSVKQLTYLAQSDNGINFKVIRKPLGEFYLKIVPWNGGWIGISKGGTLYLSKSSVFDLEKIENQIYLKKDYFGNADGDIRHAALHIIENFLYIFYTRIGDKPECILCNIINLKINPENWKISDTLVITKPTEIWEGSTLELTKSKPGPATFKKNAIRDPAILYYMNKTFMFYSVSGESGIAFQEINPSLIKKELSKDKNDLSLKKEIIFLSQKGELEKKLNQIDRIKPINRIFIMGCGRSGTWLLTSVFSTMAHTHVIPHELPIEYFGLIKSNEENLILKRNFISYQLIEEIPESIKIAYILRHPFDVLTSHNPTTQREFHIKPYRWLGEMEALKYILETNRSNVMFIKYEDLVEKPHDMQLKISNFFNLEIKDAIDNIVNTFQAPKVANDAMHGLRQIDKHSLFKYKKDRDKINYLKTIKPRLGSLLDWVAETFKYDINLQ